MLKLFSPAKINLFLKILGKRPDGYHELASLFQAISLGDTLEIALSAEDRLVCSDPSLPTNESNLVWKAINKFRQKTGLRFFVDMRLEKKIPSQAGLGGGSSNAAVALKGINQLLGQPASKMDLMSWAAEIGSDVPFFLTEGTAYVTGRGDVIKPLPPLSIPKKTLWIIKPPAGLSTPAVYAALQLGTLPLRNPLESLDSFVAGNPDYYNDLELPAFTLLPELAMIKSTLVAAGYHPVLLSGSGSALFCMGGTDPSNLLPHCAVIAAEFYMHSF